MAITFVKVSNPRRGGFFREVARCLLLLLYLLGLLLLSLAVGLYAHFLMRLPPLPEGLDAYQPPLASVVLSQEGAVMAELTNSLNERRHLVELDRLPRFLIQALVATEDSRFYDHSGVDLLAVTRAIVANLRAGHLVEGGSTLTQQLARSLLLSQRRTFDRKMREMLLARRLERRFSKEDILYLYCNQVYLGHGNYGFQAAARDYFDRNVWEISLAQAALLAGLPKAPSRYCPLTHLKRAKKRQAYVLRRMEREGIISADEHQAALVEDLGVAGSQDPFRVHAPYYAEEVRRTMEERYGADVLEQGGLEAEAAVDLRMQQAAREALDRGLKALDKRQGWRGPEAHLPSDQHDPFLERLDTMVDPGALERGRMVLALVAGVEARRARIMLGRGKEATLSLEGMAWATPPTSGRRKGRSLNDARKALSPGDVILVSQRDGKLALEQVPLVQGALLSVSAETGYVQAMVGGLDYDASEFNRAVQACRQAGSAFKPLVYSAAIDRGLTPSTRLQDLPLVEHGARGDVWIPKNSDRQFRGDVTLRSSLIRSLNVPSVHVLQYVGAKEAARWAERMGITTPLFAGPTLVLGTSCVTPWDMVRAYSVFRLLGHPAPMVTLRRTRDRWGRVLEDHTVPQDPYLSPGFVLLRAAQGASEKGARVMADSVAYVTAHLLKEAATMGTGARASKLGCPVYGKTGTTNDSQDAWFMGYTESLVTGVWVGSETNERSLGRGESGGKTALPIWRDFMEQALAGRPQTDHLVPPPPTVELARIDPETGLLARPDEGGVMEAFQMGTAPLEMAPPRRIDEPQGLYNLEAGF